MRAKSQHSVCSRFSPTIPLNLLQEQTTLSESPRDDWCCWYISTTAEPLSKNGLSGCCISTRIYTTGCVIRSVTWTQLELSTTSYTGATSVLRSVTLLMGNGAVDSTRTHPRQTHRTSHDIVGKRSQSPTNSLTDCTSYEYRGWLDFSQLYHQPIATVALNLYHISP
jgi:hypothetical protein